MLELALYGTFLIVSMVWLIVKGIEDEDYE